MSLNSCAVSSTAFSSALMVQGDQVTMSISGQQSNTTIKMSYCYLLRRLRKCVWRHNAQFPDCQSWSHHTNTRKVNERRDYKFCGTVHLVMFLYLWQFCAIKQPSISILSTRREQSYLTFYTRMILHQNVLVCNVTCTAASHGGYFRI